ncbi:hypothetical protein M8494_01180 [Serratia ureilytica]
MTPRRSASAAIEALLDSHDYDRAAVDPRAERGGAEHRHGGTADRRAASPCARQAAGADQLVRRILFARGAPAVYRGRHSHHRTPEGAVTAFMHMVEYRRNQKQQKETPALPRRPLANTADAHRLIHQALAEGATQLDTHEVQSIPAGASRPEHPADLRIAEDSAPKVHIAEQIGYPALKLRSPDIPHRRKFRASCSTCAPRPEVQRARRGDPRRVKRHLPQARTFTACWCEHGQPLPAPKSCASRWSRMRFSGPPLIMLGAKAA